MSPESFNDLYESIDKEDSDLFYITRGLKYVDLEILIDELGFRGEELSEEDQYTLFAELFFRDKIIVNGVPEDFDYSDESSLLQYRIGALKAPYTPPRARKGVVLSPSYTFQGHQKSCFAHVAANMILHNVYKLALDDAELYEQNNCNRYLDTTKEFGDYGTIETECGKSGAMRILLFHYIYRVITKRYGFNIGPLGNSILFYLQQPFRGDIFPELNHIIHPVFLSKPLDLYSLSIVHIDKFKPTEYGSYFEEYYASLHVSEPSHFFTIVGIDDAVHGKDSYTGRPFTIPIEQFRSSSIVTINDSTWQNMSFVYLLFETSKLTSYPIIVKTKIENARIKETPTPTRELSVQATQEPRASLGSPPKQPNFLAEEPEKGGRKSRKGKKTKRKRTRKNKKYELP